MNLTPLDKLLAMKGRSKADFAKSSHLGKVFQRAGVADTPELHRVRNLPKYVWQEDPEIEDLAQALSQMYGKRSRPGDCDRSLSCVCRGAGSMTLRPVQAAALQAIHDYRGLFSPIRVGGGKTLVTFLAGTIIQAKRPLLLIPAKLRHKTERDFALLSRHWKGTQPRLMSYEKLSRESGAQELEEYGPDLIMADEAHKLKNLRAACTRKLRRYLDQHDVPYVDLSGTAMKRSLLEFHHRAQWALGEERSPLPLHWTEAADWALALDVKVKAEARLRIGALAHFCDDEELGRAVATPDLAIQAARQGYRRRLVAIPGIVATEDKDDSGVALIITHRKLEMPDTVRDAFDRLRTLWETPDGHQIMEAVELWRHAREIVCGFYYRWDPPAPADWLEARREWGRFVRATLKRSRTLDSEKQVASACIAGKLPDLEYRAWTAIRDTFKPNNVPVWIHNALIEDVRSWLAEGPGLVWVEHVALGQELERQLGVPYFGQQGLDSQKRFIEDWKGPAIASIEANKEGRNLQYQWSRAYVTSAKPLGADWEQFLGRLHRDGQEADEVEVDVMLSCLEQWEGFEQARRDAQFLGDTTGQEQKLQIADVDVPTLKDVLGWYTDPLWRQS